MSGNPIWPGLKKGAILAYDLVDGSYLGKLELETEFYILNSACVNGNRVYFEASQEDEDEPNPDDNIFNTTRLISVDVNPNEINEEDRLSIGWIYEYDGDSRASPVFIEDTLYFDSFKSDTMPEIRAVRDKLYDAIPDPYACHQEWVKNDTDLKFITRFSMSSDPRGGIWYQENEINPFSENVNHSIYRINTEDKSIINTIDIDEIIGDNVNGYRPLSVLQICGDETNPIMIVSANNPFDRNYVIAIDLTDNTLLWKIQVNSLLQCDYAGGQYTFLMDENGNNPRILFGSYWGGGVFALGV